MRVVDTSAWIEWMSRSDTGYRVASEMPGPDRWVVPTLVQLELAKWARRELGEPAARPVLAFSTTCVVVPLSTNIALQAADVGSRHRLSTADAVIYATALAVGADLLTCDAHFEGLPRVHYLSKLADPDRRP